MFPLRLKKPKAFYIYFFIVSLLYAGFVIRLFPNFGFVPVARWDERTNMQVVGELLYARTFPLLTHFGEPFFEKPPLWYYLSYGLTLLFGFNTFSLRVVSVLSGFLLFYCVWRFASRWWGRVAGITSVMMLLFTNQLFLPDAGGYFSSHTFRSADPDALQIVFLLLSFYYFSLYPKKIYAGFFFAALAVLTKGPLGLLPPIVFMVHLLTKRITIYYEKIGNGFLIMLGTLLPWYLYMIFTFGRAFTDAHFGYHILGRTLVPLEEHNGAWWYYLQLLADPRVTISFLPFIFSVIFLYRSHRNVMGEFRVFAPVVIALAVLVIFSLVQTKLAWYILPAYPFMALVAGFAAQLLYNRVTR